MLTPLAFGIVVMLEPVYDFELFRRHILRYKPNFLVTAMGLLDYLMNKQPRAEAYKHFIYLCARRTKPTSPPRSGAAMWVYLFVYFPYFSLYAFIATARISIAREMSSAFMV